MAAPPVRSIVDGLPDLQLASGPHSTCHYVLPNLLAGSFPGDRSEPNHTMKIQSLLDANVDTFICLQERGELKRFTPYMKIAEKLAKKSSATVEFYHCPIPDNDVTSTEQLVMSIRTLIQRLLSGHVVYVHCWGGHGRTGTLICSFLVTCYGLTPKRAEEIYNKGEELRAARVGRWPGSASQKLGKNRVQGGFMGI